MSKRFEMRNPAHRRVALRTLAAVAMLAGVALGVSQVRGSQHQSAFTGPHFMRVGEGSFPTSIGAVRTGEPVGLDGPSQQHYADQAFPALTIKPAQVLSAARAAQAIKSHPAKKKTGWQPVGPDGVSASALVAGESTAATQKTIFSGRISALAVSPACTGSKTCPMLVGAAGGGIWRTTSALSKNVKWTSSSSGLGTSAIGSIAYDPNDSTGQTVYVGTGEPNGSSDSEAGVGLFKSTNGGQSWSLVAGSTLGNAPCAADGGATTTCPVATGRSIGAVAVNPSNPLDILIGTDVARHGSSSINGGRFTPPGSAQVGLYESTDGGATFTSRVILAQDVADPTSATGGDFFRGGATHVEISPTGDVYASFFDYGLYRRAPTLDGDTAFHPIFASAGGGTVGNSSFSRTEFALAPNGGALRVYLGDIGGGAADFYTVADANVTAATLFTGGTNGGWTLKSDPTNGTPGFGSYNYCDPQCSYDMPVYSPRGLPDLVYIGGAMQYDEIFTGDPIPFRSNGRAVQRSQDDGTNFTDMTVDSKGVSLHPDQHVITGVPFTSDTVFIGNDGGLWRLDGSFVDVSAQCAGRGLSGADLTDCQNWLSRTPKQIASLNDGLQTLQFQSLSLNPQKPSKEVMGGTQDNGTQTTSNGKKWSVTIFGDGGQSGFNHSNPNIRMHTFFSPNGDVNFKGAKETGWDFMAGPLLGSGEGASFYVPLIADPVVGGTWFIGLQHVWRTLDNAGSQAQLDSQCNEFTGTGPFDTTCGDWVPMGGSALNAAGDLSGTFYGTDKNPGSSGYVVAIGRPPTVGNGGTLWAGLRRGRVFFTQNADNATPASVAFYRIDGKDTDTTPTPTRFVSGIAVDPADPNHAYVSFSGYDAYATAAGTATGHVFSVTVDPTTCGVVTATTCTATWTDISNDLGDQPVTGIAYDSVNGDLYASTDFGVDVLSPASSDTTWEPASTGLPTVAVWGLTIDTSNRLLYAATHGRSAWVLNLS